MDGTFFIAVHDHHSGNVRTHRTGDGDGTGSSHPQALLEKNSLRRGSALAHCKHDQHRRGLGRDGGGGKLGVRRVIRRSAFKHDHRDIAPRSLCPLSDLREVSEVSDSLLVCIRSDGDGRARSMERSRLQYDCAACHTQQGLPDEHRRAARDDHFTVPVFLAGR